MEGISSVEWIKDQGTARVCSGNVSVEYTQSVSSVRMSNVVVEFS